MAANEEFDELAARVRMQLETMLALLDKLGDEPGVHEASEAIDEALDQVDAACEALRGGDDG